MPANQIVGAQPGEIFVHRNIANMVVHSDMNMPSVLDCRERLKGKACDRVWPLWLWRSTGCDGNSSIGLIDNWLRNIKDVYRWHKDELEAISDEKERFDRFVEVNVKEQVFDLASTSIVQNVWNKDQQLHLHGWVYGIGSGIIKDLGVNVSNDSELDKVYQLNF